MKNELTVENAVHRLMALGLRIVEPARSANTPLVPKQNPPLNSDVQRGGSPALDRHSQPKG
jgi:hypothetical protein